jgi:hypothetical protein
MTDKQLNPEIPMISSTELPDMEQFEGARTKIEGWEIAKVNSLYDETGKKIDVPILVDVVKIYTEQLGSGKKADGSDFPIRASTIFNLKKDTKGNLGLSAHPKSNVQKFFKKLKVNSLAECKDKYVTVTVDSSGWLRIVY